jgi:hypothetical protein
LVLFPAFGIRDQSVTILAGAIHCFRPDISRHQKRHLADRRIVQSRINVIVFAAINYLFAGPHLADDFRCLDQPFGTLAPGYPSFAGAFLAAHKKVHLHFAPTYSSWLNQVERWFAKIERDVIARGVFTSLPNLKRKLMRYIRHYNQAPKTVKWTYFDPTRRITSQSFVTVH